MPTEVLAPANPEGIWIEEPVTPKHELAEQVLSPVPERSTELLVDEYAEARLRPFEKRGGHMPEGNLLEQPPRAAIARLEVRGHASWKLDHIGTPEVKGPASPNDEPP